MYKIKKIGKNTYVGIAQTGSGWNTATWNVRKGHTPKKAKVQWIENRKHRTLAAAKKDFTQQSKRYAEKPVKKAAPKRKTTSSKSSPNWLGFDFKGPF